MHFYLLNLLKNLLQFEQIKTIESKKQNKSPSKGKGQKFAELRDKSRELFEVQKKYLEDRPIISPRAFSPRRFEDDLVPMSDEQDAESDGSTSVSTTSREKPGNAQFLETPRVQQQIDFRQVAQDEVFGKKKEVYRMKPEKLALVDCQLCQLLYDYTNICQHFSQLNSSDLEDLKAMMPGISQHRDIAQKKQALQKVTRSLDVLSTFKITSLTLLQGQFLEIVLLYLKRDLSILLGEYSEFICQECCSQSPPSQEGSSKVTFAQHALIMINRSLTYQVQTQILNQKEELMRSSGMEEEKSPASLDPKITHAITEELLIEFNLGSQKGMAAQNFSYLQLLIRGITNSLILDPEQRQLLVQIQQKQILAKIMKLLNQIDSDLLQTVNSVQGLCLFVTHSFRLFIICLSIDPKALDQPESEPSLRQILRKYDLYEIAFPQNAKLIKALKGDMLIFRHASKGCHILQYQYVFLFQGLLKIIIHCFFSNYQIYTEHDDEKLHQSMEIITTKREKIQFQKESWKLISFSLSFQV